MNKKMPIALVGPWSHGRHRRLNHWLPYLTLLYWIPVNIFWKIKNFAWHRPLFWDTASQFMAKKRVFLHPMMALAMNIRHRVQTGSLDHWLGSKTPLNHSFHGFFQHWARFKGRHAHVRPRFGNLVVNFYCPGFNLGAGEDLRPIGQLRQFL